MVRTINKVYSQHSRKTSSANNDIRSSQMDNEKRKKRRDKNRAIREIKFYQKTTGLLLRKLPFMRLVKDILDELRPRIGYKWKENALLALQEMAEDFLIELFEHTNIVAINSKRVTIKVDDLRVVRRIRGPTDVCNR